MVQSDPITLHTKEPLVEKDSIMVRCKTCGKSQKQVRNSVATDASNCCHCNDMMEIGR
jgi:hypothetical protein